MKQKLFSALFSLFAVFAFSQIKYEKAYIINNSGNRIECFIKNAEWLNNPETFEYKLTEDGAKMTGNVQNVKEFGIENSSRFVRAEVMIDQSSNKIGNLSLKKEPEYQQKIRFLKVLVKGKANLFYLEEKNTQNFFYSKNEGEVIPLIYKRYMVNQKATATNDDYKLQLKNDLQCGTSDQQDTDRLKYYKNELISYFVKYNICSNEDYKEYSMTNNVQKISVTPFIGAGFNSLKIERDGQERLNFIFPTNTSIRFGIDLVYTLPFNRNKVGLFIQPTYNSYKGEAERGEELNSGNPFKYKSIIEYHSIEVPVGVRYNMFLNQRSKLFVDAAFIFDFSFNSKLSFNYRTDIPVSSIGSFGLGLGYKFDDRLFIQARYQTDRILTDNEGIDKSSYSSASLIIGYTIFK